MKKILIGLLMLPWLAVASSLDDAIKNQLHAYVNDEMTQDILKGYIAPPYDPISYQRFEDMNKSCSSIMDKHITEKDFSLLLKDDVWNLMAFGDQSNSMTGDVINKSGGFSAISDYLNADFVSMMNRSHSSLSREKNMAEYKKYKSSPMAKKLEKKAEDMMGFMDNKKSKNEDERQMAVAIGICFFTKFYYPVFGVKESVHGSTLYNLNRNFRRSELNGVMNSLDKAVKDTEKVKELYNY